MSGATKFTPGPWKLHTDCQPEVRVGPDSGFQPVGTCECCGLWLNAEDETTAQADARLIAAAPRMFELLDAIVSDDALLDPEQNGAASALLAEIRGGQS